jgi:hypothetical protein
MVTNTIILFMPDKAVSPCPVPLPVIILVGNKTDLEAHREVGTEEAQAFAERFDRPSVLGSVFLVCMVRWWCEVD